MTNILILGPGKTGTTAVYDRVKRALVADEEMYYYLFEPSSRTPFDALPLLAPHRSILSKVMLHHERRFDLPYDAFEKRVMTVRDPRDVLVSRTLFRPLIQAATLSDAAIRKFLDAVREKERDPGSWSLRRLNELGDDLGVGSSAWRPWTLVMARQLELDRSHAFFGSRYEHFVAGDLDELAGYLDLDLDPANQETMGWLGHIARSLGTGEWRHWFTDDDVDFFRPMINDFNEYYGYHDWDLAPEPHIDPENGSIYIERKLETRLRQLKARETETPASRLSDADVDALRNMAADGRGDAAVRLAELLRDPNSGHHDAREARAVAEQAALRGHVRAMRLLAAWSTGVEQSYWQSQASFWSDAPAPDVTVGNRYNGRTAKQWNAEVRRLRRRIRALESSRSVRAGRAIGDAVKKPGRNTLHLPARLWRIALSTREIH